MSTQSWVPIAVADARQHAKTFEVCDHKWVARMLVVEAHGATATSERKSAHYLAPDTAIESVSACETACDTCEKTHDYLKAGGAQVWMLYPATRQVTVYQPGGEGRTYSQDESISKLTGLGQLAIDMAEVFDV
ncbi:MAG: hypothetical protein GYB68_09370 [Chloroflexi bacterium]|nr:hypothetical protein [Chloroflexota bacterium]